MKRWATYAKHAGESVAIDDARLKGIAGARNDLYIDADELDEAADKHGQPPMVRWGNWSGAHAAAKWFIPERLSGSDYSGGFVSKANYLTFIEEFGEGDQWNQPFYAELSGGHGTYGIALYIDRTPDEVWEFLEQLEDYSVASDEKLSELEMEETERAWDSWGRQEWVGGLSQKFGIECDDADESELREHFEQARENANIYWEAQGDTPQMWVDMERVLDTLDDPAGAPCAGGAGGEGDTREKLEAAGFRPDDELKGDGWIKEVGERLYVITDEDGNAPKADEYLKVGIYERDRDCEWQPVDYDDYENLELALEQIGQRESERPPRGQWSAKQIAAFRGQGLRPGYDFNPRLTGDIDFEDFLRTDPYRNLQIGPQERVIHNLAHDSDPATHGMLVVAVAGRPLLNAWWRMTKDSYHVVTLDLSSVPPSEVLDMGRWSRGDEQAVRDEANRWIGAPNFLAAAGASTSALERALFYRWYNDANILRALYQLRDGAPGVLFSGTVPAQAFEVPQLLAQSTAPAVSPLELLEEKWAAEHTSEPVPERAPRYPYSAKRIAALRQQGLRQGYDFNGRYWVYALTKRGDQVLSSEGPWGPYDLPSAKSYARISATQGTHDRIVTEGRQGSLVRHYQAGTGERIA